MTKTGAAGPARRAPRRAAAFSPFGTNMGNDVTTGRVDCAVMHHFVFAVYAVHLKTTIEL